MVEHHRHRAREIGRIAFAVLTISDTKSAAEDGSGAEIAKAIEAAGHEVRHRMVVTDDVGRIRGAVAGFLGDAGVQAVVTTGGTGITSRDVTPEALSPLAEKTLDGFGEMFRSVSARDVGSAAMVSRAFAFIARKKVVFCLPGSPRAVALAMSDLVIPEVAHIVAELGR